MDRDPFELLGIESTSTAADVHRARRRLAKRAHPDHGGDPARMQEINAAADAALNALITPAPRPDVAPGPEQPSADPPSAGDDAGDADDADDEARGRWRRVATDSPSFTIEALPVEAFEALVIVANWAGEVLVDDPPYVLEAHLFEPFECWCRLEILPDAGASTVSIAVATFEENSSPDVDAVRDAWIAGLNQLDWSQLHHDRLGDDRLGDDRPGPNRSPPS
jgi:hypothetical protein